MYASEKFVPTNRDRKDYLVKKGLVSCTFCPYHKLENASHSKYFSKTWKNHTKARKQWGKENKK